MADLNLVEQFLNTLDERSFRWHGEQRVPNDEWSSPEALRAWLEAHRLVAAGQEIQPSELAAAIALRSALRSALRDAPTDGDASSGDEDNGGGGGEISQALAAFPLRLAPDASGRLRIAADSGVPGLDPIVETVAASVAGGGWSRLKLCSAADCRWAFYDTSRNGGGRWCSMEACGNRSKTRAYRSRLLTAS